MKVNKIIVHCADTPPSMDIGADEIRKWHLEKGWSDIGYHFIIRRNGSVETGRDLDTQGAHVAGHNHDSIGICLVGGRHGKFDFTRPALVALEVVIRDLLLQFPDAEVSGHNDFDSGKQCPAFDVKQWWYS